MFGFRFVKFEPSDYIFVMKKGRAVKQGQGLALWYFAPTTSFIRIPVGGMSSPFIFEELSSDFQTISLQGEVIFRIAEPEKIRDQVNYSIDSRTLAYLSDDPAKLDQRITNILKTAAKREIEKLPLRETIRSADFLKRSISDNLAADGYIGSMGIRITNINILSILPTKETARALEAQTREKILKEADDAIYERRNYAVAQERTIKENELNTEIAIENKKRQIRETQMEAERSVKEKERQLIAEQMAFNIEQEKENSKLVERSALNSKIESDSKAYSMETMLKTVKTLDPEALRVLGMSGMKPNQMIAAAFEIIAKNAGKIGELNISPELLRTLLKEEK